MSIISSRPNTKADTTKTGVVCAAVRFWSVKFITAGSK